MSCAMLLLILGWSLIPAPAYAYIDPGTGSYMVQVVAATLLGALYTLKVYWHKIRAMFGGKPPEDAPNAGGPDERKDPPADPPVS